MDWTQPVSISPPADVTPFQRITALLGYCDCRLYFSDSAYVDVGAGALPVIKNLIFVPTDHVGRLGTIGRYCEFNSDAKIFVRSEHGNNAPVNTTFPGMPLMRAGFANSVMLPLKPFSIGNGVLASLGVCVLDGVKVGDGVVLGAGAVVTKDTGTFGVYAGVPARRIKTRDPFAPWWDFDPVYMLQNKAVIQGLAADLTAPHRYRPERPRFCLRLDDGNLSFLGIQDGEAIAPLASAPQSVQAYVIQAFKAESPVWIADCWA